LGSFGEFCYQKFLIAKQCLIGEKLFEEYLNLKKIKIYYELLSGNGKWIQI
jgi:hypothetical protein